MMSSLVPVRRAYTSRLQRRKRLTPQRGAVDRLHKILAVITGDGGCGNSAPDQPAAPAASATNRAATGNPGFLDRDTSMVYEGRRLQGAFLSLRNREARR
jgi:hypothetical protein